MDSYFIRTDMDPLGLDEQDREALYRLVLAIEELSEKIKHLPRHLYQFMDYPSPSAIREATPPVQRQVSRFSRENGEYHDRKQREITINGQNIILDYQETLQAERGDACLLIEEHWSVDRKMVRGQGLPFSLVFSITHNANHLNKTHMTSSHPCWIQNDTFSEMWRQFIHKDIVNLIEKDYRRIDKPLPPKDSEHYQLYFDTFFSRNSIDFGRKLFDVDVHA